MTDNAKSYPMSIFAEFKSEQEREDFFVKYVKPNTKLNNGPIFSYSLEDESEYKEKFFDRCTAP